MAASSGAAAEPPCASLCRGSPTSSRRSSKQSMRSSQSSNRSATPPLSAAQLQMRRLSSVRPPQMSPRSLASCDLMQGRPPTVENLRLALEEAGLRQARNAKVLRDAGAMGQELLAQECILDAKLQDLQMQLRFGDQSRSRGEGSFSARGQLSARGPRRSGFDEALEREEREAPLSQQGCELSRKLDRLRIQNESLKEELEDREAELHGTLLSARRSEPSDAGSPGAPSPCPTVVALRAELSDLTAKSAKAVGARQKEIQAAEAEVVEAKEQYEAVHGVLERQRETAQVCNAQLRLELQVERELTERACECLQQSIDDLGKEIAERESILAAAARSRSRSSLGTCTPGGASTTSANGSEVWHNQVRQELLDAGLGRGVLAVAKVVKHAGVSGATAAAVAQERVAAVAVTGTGDAPLSRAESFSSRGSTSTRASRLRLRKTVVGYKNLEEVLRPCPIVEPFGGGLSLGSLWSLLEG